MSAEPAGAATARIAHALSGHGLIPRGGFDFDPGEDAPPGPSGAPAKAVLMVGQGGGAPWPHFQAWRARQPNALQNPLDTWSRDVIGAVAAQVGARAVSPADRPYLPFQRWAMRAEGMKASPLGILMHPEFGLWHAYRGALLFDRALNLSAPPPAGHPCDSCAQKPCLSACPVGACSAGGFAHEVCLAHVRGAAGGPCREAGCRARNACPVGTAYRYPDAVQAFHMSAFARP